MSLFALAFSFACANRQLSCVNLKAHQKMYFAANCRIRGELAELMTPNVAKFHAAAGLEKLGWFSELKASNRT